MSFEKDACILHIDSDENGTAPIIICLKERFKSVFCLIRETKLSVNDFSDAYFLMFGYPLNDSVELSGLTLEDLVKEFGYHFENGFISILSLKNESKSNGIIRPKPGKITNGVKHENTTQNIIKSFKKIDQIIPFQRKILVSTFHTLQLIDGLVISQCPFAKFCLPEVVNKNLKRLEIVNATSLQSLMISQFFSSNEKDFVIETPRFEGITTALAVALVTIVSDLKSTNEYKPKPKAPIVIVLFESLVKASYGRKTFQQIASETDVKCVLFDDVFDNERKNDCDIFISTPEVLRAFFPKIKPRLDTENLKIICLDNGDYIMKNFGIVATVDLMMTIDPDRSCMKIFTSDRLYDTRRQELLRWVRNNTIYMRVQRE